MGDFDVRRTFAMSYMAMRDSDQPLEREAARAFLLLGRVWSARAVTPQSAAALLDVTETRAAAVLDVLADAHLVLNPEPDRYLLHDLLGEYAAQREEEDGEAEPTTALVRLLSWYATALAAATRAATGETQSPPPLEGEAVRKLSLPEFADDDEAIRWTARELPAVRDALTRAGELGRSDLAWRLAVGLFGHATTHWWTGEWDACLEQAMEIARAHDDRLGQAWLHRRTAVAHGMAYRNEACLEHLRIALDLFTERGDLAAQASILGNMAAVYLQWRGLRAGPRPRRALARPVPPGREHPGRGARPHADGGRPPAARRTGVGGRGLPPGHRAAQRDRPRGGSRDQSHRLRRRAARPRAPRRGLRGPGRGALHPAPHERPGRYGRLPGRHRPGPPPLRGVGSPHETWEWCLELARRHRLDQRIDECLDSLKALASRALADGTAREAPTASPPPPAPTPRDRRPSHRAAERRSRMPARRASRAARRSGHSPAMIEKTADRGDGPPRPGPRSG
ncbi:hypothetical protein STANM309S_01172 [Streptomyces tanashiensis]